MGDQIVVTFDGQDYLVTLRDKDPFQDLVIDKNGDVGDNPDIYSAYELEDRTDMPLLPIFVKTVDGIPADEVSGKVSWIVMPQVIHQFYSETDASLEIHAVAHQFTVMLDELRRMFDFGNFLTTWGEMIETLKPMSDTMERLRNLGEGAPTWAIADPQ